MSRPKTFYACARIKAFFWMRGQFVVTSYWTEAAQVASYNTAMSMYSFQDDCTFQPLSDSLVRASTPVRGPRAVSNITNRLDDQREEIEEMKLRQSHLEERLATQQQENDALHVQLRALLDKEVVPRKQKQHLPIRSSVYAACGLVLWYILWYPHTFTYGYMLLQKRVRSIYNSFDEEEEFDLSKRYSASRCMQENTGNWNFCRNAPFIYTTCRSSVRVHV